VRAKLDGGWLPDFPAKTRAIREGDWTVSPIPDDLLDRRVENTGPVDREDDSIEEIRGAGPKLAKPRTHLAF
jgi:hypothetical protein